MDLMRRASLLVTLLTGLLCVSPALTAQAPSRIIAIGDIHGSIDGLTTILKATGLIDGSHAWTGGKATLMQTGDYMDRGEQTRAEIGRAHV